MKFKLITLILVVISFNYSYSQTKELFVEYDFYFKDYYPENQKIELTATKEVQLSTTKRTIMKRYFNKKKGETSEAKPSTSSKYIFKNKNSLIYKEGHSPDHRKNHFVKETLNQFNWKFTGNKKIILKYLCQEASTTYRGRDYIAYFTTELPFKAAPWKFHGLPGVTLEVRTSDDKIKIEAKLLKIQTNTKPIKNPFAEKVFVSWEEYKKICIKEREDRMNRTTSKLSSVSMRSSSGPKVFTGAEYRIELIVPESIISYKEQMKKIKKNK